MPLVVMCGYPCSGKSKRADELKGYFENSRGKKVHLVGDESITLDRNVAYASKVYVRKIAYCAYSLILGPS